MNILTFLEYNDSLKKTWVGSRDARAKMFFSLSILVLLFYSHKIIEFIYLSVILFTIVILTFGLKYLVNFILAMKYFILLISLINYVLLDFSLSIDIIIFVLKILLLMLAFSIFNKTSNADEVVDALIKLKIPPQMAWIIGTSMRQAFFITDDFIEQMQFLQMKSKEKGIRSKVNMITPILINIYSNAIINAGHLADTLQTRKWNGAHKEITLYSKNFDFHDSLFVLFTIIFSIIFFLLI